MDFQTLNKYEFKNPSYDLHDRSYPIDSKYQKQARYTYDSNTGIFCSRSDKKQEISLLFAGDLLCQENMLKKHHTKDGYDFSLCFEYIRPLLRSADFSAGNLETPVSHTAPYRGEIITHEGPYYCNAPLHFLESLAYAGFDMLYTANNHTLDTGARGLCETIENTQKFGMLQTGTFTQKQEKFIVVDICGFKVGFTSFSLTYNSMDDNLTAEGKSVLLNTYSKASAKSIYKALKEKGAEYVVCFPHWGKEYTDIIDDKQEKIANDLTLIGYDLVVGSHAHVIQKASVINGKPVLYSLGNLISHLNLVAKVRNVSALTVLYNLKLKRVDNQIVPEVSAIPCKIIRNYKNIPFTVVPVVKDLNIPMDLKILISDVNTEVKKQLKTDALPTNINFRILPEEADNFKLALSQIPAKTSALVPLKDKSVTVPETILETVTDRGGIYAIYKEHAELLHLIAPSTSNTFSPPKLIKGKKVTVYSNTGHANDFSKLIYLPTSVEVINHGMFKNFTALESLRIFKGLKIIKSNAFENCVSLTGLIMPKTLEEIHKNAFLGCCKLLSIKLPSSVHFIDDTAFVGCDKLTIYCEPGSYAEAYAVSHNIKISYMQEDSQEPLFEYEALDEIFKPFAGPAEVPEDAEEMALVRKNLPAVKMGPMNGSNDKHPATIIQVCELLKNPLPNNAVCKNQPSYYIQPSHWDGKLSTIAKLLPNHLSVFSEDDLKTHYRLFRAKYQTQKSLDRNAIDFTIYFCDWLLFTLNKGFSHNDYFDFEFYNKEMDVRSTFVDEVFRLRVYKVCAQRGFRDTFKNKPSFNQKFAEFIKRDWLDVTTATFEDFKQFVEKHERFFVKPLGRCGGAGAHVMERSSDTIENLYAQCLAEGVIAEEILVQHDDLAAMNSSTLNTIRVLTLLDSDNVPHVLLGVARFGRSGNVVDNFHGGGVGAIVDVETGVVITEAINQDHIRKPIHPDSKLPILGFRYPQWEKIKETAMKAALIVPEVRNVGWDFAVLKNGDVAIVEGNSRSGFDILQSPDQIGRKYLYEPYFQNLEKLFKERVAAEKKLNSKPLPKKTGFKPFAGPAEVPEDAEEMALVRKNLPAVKMGPMNGPNDKHPETILATCKLLNQPLPDHAVCANAPSYYIQPEEWDGRLVTIKKLLGENLPEIDSDELKLLYKQFRLKYQAQKSMNRNAIDFTVYFCDWLLFTMNSGFTFSDYFEFELYNKEPDIRDTFVSEEFRLKLYRLTAQKGYRDIFKNKPDFNEKFAEFIKRDWINTTDCSFEEFKEFASKHERFFVKPLGRCGGRGARVIETGSDTLENLYEELHNEQVLAEEILVQHDDIAAFNSSALNTIRVLTLLDADNVPHVLLASARFSRKGSVVDNFSGNGICALVDVETGIISTEAIDHDHIRRPIHPDSKRPILGYKYPEWDKIKEMALKAALIVPEVRHVGWDFAVLKNGEVAIIEGNSRSGFNILQVPDQLGKKYLYTPHMKKLRKLKKTETKSE